jgi:hypothetical protein
MDVTTKKKGKYECMRVYQQKFCQELPTSGVLQKPPKQEMVVVE